MLTVTDTPQCFLDVESLDTMAAVSPTATGPHRVLARGPLTLTVTDTAAALLPTLDAPSPTATGPHRVLTARGPLMPTPTVTDMPLSVMDMACGLGHAHCFGPATTTMNTFLFFSTLIAYCSASTTVVGNAAPYLVRAPAHDSASIEHHRLGGNFAYSTAEAHAYAEVIPQISTPIATHQPAPIVKTHHVAQPIFKNVPTYG